MTLRYATLKKAHARRDTIVDYYRAVFGLDRLPEHKQYWSMCSVCVDPDGNALPRSELHQVIEAGLIQPHQFHGVDHDETVCAANQRYRLATWHCDDFYDAISTAADTPDFDPGIVNVDTVSEPKHGVDLFCRILERLCVVPDVLFVGNFITKNRGHEYTVEDVVEQINQHPRFREVAHTLRWDPARTFYRYRGATKKGRTKMCTVLLWRRS